ncbi:MAG TPA: hypothetical protein VGG47_14430 [Acidocella sp.]
MIQAGRILLLAGTETLLAQLPAGRWIGGSAVAYLGNPNGATERDRIFYSDLTDHAQTAEILLLDASELPGLARRYPENGFSFLILPGLSELLVSFARDAADYPGLYNSPLIGWISAVDLAGPLARPKIFAGNGQAHAEHGALMHVSLPRRLAAQIDVINLFSTGKGAAITFSEDGLSATSCLVDGVPQNLAAYIMRHRIDTNLPLIADYNGAAMNVSIRAVDAQAQCVDFFAPVFKTLTYRFANPLRDFPAAFDRAIATIEPGDIAFACTCVLNYRQARLEGRRAGPFTGPVTFGEIAYIALNQTLACLSIVSLDNDESDDF